MYRASQQSGAGAGAGAAGDGDAGAGAGASGGKEGVVDADFEEVDENRKSGSA
jgi:hypothetical protein